MRYCLPCRVEYIDSVHACPDCGARTLTPAEHALVKLVESDLAHESMVPVKVLEGPVDTAFLGEMMDVANIPHVIHENVGAFGGAFTTHDGWGVLLVIESMAEQARELVRQYDASVID